MWPIIAFLTPKWALYDPKIDCFQFDEKAEVNDCPGVIVKGMNLQG